MVFEPKKITASEAYRQTKIGYKENCLRELNQAYEIIENAANQGISKLSLYYHDFVMANKIFAELTSQGYRTCLTYDDTHDDTYDDERWKLEVSWSILDLDPNKKYILPMDDTDIVAPYCSEKAYAYKHDDGYWDIERFYGEWDGRPTYIIVTAKDIEEAPDWVRAIEPVEVEE